MGYLERYDRLGISYRQLDYWTRRGYLHPVQTEPGTGYPREWPELELRVAYNIGQLVRAGLRLDVAARLARTPEALYVLALLKE